jgi:hypothetical protein
METAPKHSTPPGEYDDEPILLSVNEPINLTVIGDRPATPRRDSPTPVAPSHYRAVNMWAVLSIVSAIATLAMIFGWPFIVFPLAAYYCGRTALLKIRRSPEEYTGVQLAKTGIGLGVGLGVIFSGWLVFGKSDVPHGYQVLDYATLEPDPNSHGRVPSAAMDLSNKQTNVFVRGYMLPPPRGQSTGLTKFSICRTSDMCKFGMNLARPEDQIHIELTGDRTMRYTTGEIGIGGRFSVETDQYPQPYYLIKADYP